MRFLRFALPLAALFPATITASCADDQPRVTGFGGKTVFTYPPEEDADVALDDAVTYQTDMNISFTGLQGGNKVNVTLNLSDYYTNTTELEIFVKMCEELWILNQYNSEGTAILGGYNHTPVGFCFNGDTAGADPSYYYDPERNTVLAGFVIDTCHGNGNTSKTVEERLEELSDSVETMLAVVEDLARKITFDSTPFETFARNLKEAESLEGNEPGDICDDPMCQNNTRVCLEYKKCFADELEKQTGSSAAEIVNDAFLYSECFNVSYADLVAKKDGACPSDTEGGCSPYPITDGLGGCLAEGQPSEPVCPSWLEPHFETYVPDYCYPEKYPKFGIAMEPLVRLGFLCKRDGDVDYSDRSSADALGITRIVKVTLQSLQIANELLKDALPDWFLFAWKIIPFVANAITISLIDTILDLNALHNGLVDGVESEAVYENTVQLLTGSASIYDEVVCRCTTADRRGQGCDSVDNDCDKSIDEDDEDHFPPEIDISDAYLNCASGNGKTKWFRSEADALACVSAFSSVSDDCDSTTVLETPDLEATCANATITLSARDRSGNSAEPATVPIYLDEAVPVVSCSLNSTSSQKVLYVGETGFGVMTDVGLVYDATDNCGFPMDVKVDVFANENEFGSKSGSAFLYRNGMSHNRVGLYVEAKICGPSESCLKDPNLMNARVYTVVISASDQAGNTATPAKCKVVIVPSSNVGVINPANASQGFLLTSYNSTFKGYGA